MTARTWIRGRALPLAVMAMFLLFLEGQVGTGLAEYNSEQAEHGLATADLAMDIRNILPAAPALTRTARSPSTPTTS